ncbi:MAG: hypothetical protein ACOYJY_06410 [Acutalibacteraceae bacterium]|jgi:hypothetical protein
MPAVIAHALFARQVLSRCERRGVPVYDRDMALIGAQGPDVFFFHRAFPWEIGKMNFHAGQELHHRHPAAVTDALRQSVRRETVAPDFARGYLQGFLCHYALDRTAHPFILAWQKRLRRDRPGYARSDSAYHFCLESALDTLSLRRFTGRRIGDFSLTGLIPPDRQGRYAAFARLYRPVFWQILDRPVSERYLALAPGDMRQALFWMTDKRGCRAAVLRGGQRLLGTGAVATSLLRPQTADDWDYANLSHRRWQDPFDPTHTHTADFFALWEKAADEAIELIAALLETDRPTAAVVGNRDFTGYPVKS